MPVSQLFEQLESRRLLAATLSNFRAEDPVIRPDQWPSFSVDVIPGPGEQVSAVTFYRDVNENGGWDPGIDQDLGVGRRAGGPAGYRLTVGPPGWTGTNRIVADAVTTDGEWAEERVSLDLRITLQPRMEEFGVLAGGPGFLPRAFARVSDDNGIQSVRFYMDLIHDGTWDPTVDPIVAEVTTPDPDGVYRAWLPADPATWPMFPMIGSFVTDTDGERAAAAPVATTYDGFEDSPGPVLSDFRMSQQWEYFDGKRMSFSVRASDNSRVRAVTFFVDYDDDGRWTPGVDESITTKKVASLGRYTGELATDFGGKPQISIIADAQDFDGQWSSQRVSVTAQNHGAVVQEVEASWFRGTELKVRVTVGYPMLFGRTPPGELEYFVFADMNHSARYESYEDRVIDSGAVALDAQTGVGRVTRIIDLGSDFTVYLNYGAGITSVAGNFSQAVISPTRFAPLLVHDIYRPQVTSMEVHFGDGAEAPRPGVGFTVTGTWTSVRGARVITLFWDKNLNGTWNPGTDIDLTQQTLSGTSGVFTLQGTLTFQMFGTGAFAASVRDGGPDGGRWSVPMSPHTSQVFSEPIVTRVTGNRTVAAGSPLVLDASFRDPSSVRATTAFIDVNGDGLFNGTDASFTATAINLLSGARYEGTMRLTLDTTGLAPGTYRLWVASSDYYRGHDLGPGGRMNGLWSGRFGVEITIT